MMPPARTNLIVPLTHSDAPAMRAAMAQAAAAGADMVECRLDFLTGCDSASLRELLRGRPLPVIITCRPKRQGGLYAGDESRRLALLQEALDLGAEYVDVECDVPPDRRPHVSFGATAAESAAVSANTPANAAGVAPAPLAAKPAAPHVPQPPSAGESSRIILSYHDFSAKPANLSGILADLAAQRPAVCKIAFAAQGPQDAIDALAALRECPLPVIVLAMGEAGLASRVLAKKFNAFGTFAALAAGSESAPGQPTIQELKQLYRWDSISPATAVYGVVGCPIAHSMSPAIHNAAFAGNALDAVYLPLRVEPGEDDFRAFMDACRQASWLHVDGLSVTIPHKEHALRYVGSANVDELSRQIGAINTITLGRDGSLRGTNTDYAGALDALTAAMGIAREGLHSRRAGVIGAGGVSRAIVAGLRHYGADVVIYNRTVERAHALAEEFACRWAALDALGEPLDILINCTSVGMHPQVDSMPLPEESLVRLAKATPDLVVFDTVYNPVQTRLLARADELSCRCASGVEMFVNQAMQQFAFWTGQVAHRETLRQIVLRRLYAAR